MKKTIILTIATGFIFCCLSFTNMTANDSKPTLYSQIEKYYQQRSVQPVNPEHLASLDKIALYIKQNAKEKKKSRLLVTDIDNSFTSQAAQIILQSMISVNKMDDKININSCGYQDTEVNIELINLLMQHGFEIREINPINNNLNDFNPPKPKKTYEIKFSDKIEPLIIYAKGQADGSLSKNNFVQIKMCPTSDKNNLCADIAKSIFKESLPFNNLASEDMHNSAGQMLDEMVSEMNYLISHINN